MSRLRSRMISLKKADQIAQELRCQAKHLNGSGGLLIQAAETIESLTKENDSLRYHGVTKKLVNTIFRRVFAEVIREAMSHPLGQRLVMDQISMAEVEDNPLFHIAIILADTNYLRYWNNVFMSHETGNQVLRMTSQVLDDTIEGLAQEHFREGLPFHIGGDEFIILLDGCPRGNEDYVMAVSSCLLEEADGITGAHLPVSASFGNSHLLDAISLFRQMCRFRTDLRPQSHRNLCTSLMQIMEWMSDARNYLAKTTYRLLLLKNLAENLREVNPKEFSRYWGFLHEGTRITLEELRKVEMFNGETAFHVAWAIAIDHTKQLIQELYAGYERIDRHDFDHRLIEIMVKEVVCGLPVTLPDQGAPPRSRGLLTL